MESWCTNILNMAAYTNNTNILNYYAHHGHANLCQQVCFYIYDLFGINNNTNKTFFSIVAKIDSIFLIVVSCQTMPEKLFYLLLLATQILLIVANRGQKPCNCCELETKFLYVAHCRIPQYHSIFKTPRSSILQFQLNKF